jgi:hypothetical protein
MNQLGWRQQIRSEVNVQHQQDQQDEDMTMYQGLERQEEHFNDGAVATKSTKERAPICKTGCRGTKGQRPHLGGLEQSRFWTLELET